jgi:hypothetical protein
MGNGGYANPFLMPDVPMNLDAFAESFGWVGDDMSLKHSLREITDVLTGRLSTAGATPTLLKRE